MKNKFKNIPFQEKKQIPQIVEYKQILISYKIFLITKNKINQSIIQKKKYEFNQPKIF